MAFSPDGETLASGSSDRTVRLWDLVTRKEIATLRGHTDDVNKVAFAPDGKILASASDDGTTRLWDATLTLRAGTRRREIATLRARPLAGPAQSGIGWVAFSPNGKLLAEGRSDETVRFWDLATHQEVGSIRCPWGLIFSGAFSPDGRLLATGHYGPVVRLCDVASRRQVAAFRGHRAQVLGVAFSPDGSTLATASSEDGTVRLWRAATFAETDAAAGATGRPSTR